MFWKFDMACFGLYFCKKLFTILLLLLLSAFLMVLAFLELFIPPKFPLSSPTYVVVNVLLR